MLSDKTTLSVELSMKRKETVSRARPKCEIIDYGIYTEDRRGDPVADPKTIDGVWYELTNVTLLKRTSVIPAEIDLLFGIRYKVIGPESLGIITLENEVQMPPILNRATSKPVTTTCFSCETLPNEESASMFSFDCPSDMAEGKWTFLVKHNDETLLTKVFRVKAHRA